MIVKDIIKDIENEFIESLEVDRTKIPLTKDNLIGFLKNKYNIK